MYKIERLYKTILKETIYPTSGRNLNSGFPLKLWVLFDWDMDPAKSPLKSLFNELVVVEHIGGRKVVELVDLSFDHKCLLVKNINEPYSKSLETILFDDIVDLYVVLGESENLTRFSIGPIKQNRKSC